MAEDTNQSGSANGEAKNKDLRGSETAAVRNPVLYDRVQRAVKIAALDESVERFAAGYDTVVGERGVTLSGGQKQRAAIARMLVQDTPIMVFDDSLSAVDAETDVKIRQALKSVMGNRTVILISHRIATLMEADQIVVLEGGQIRQRGTHEELLREPGLYRHIYEIQNPEEREFAATEQNAPEEGGAV